MECHFPISRLRRFCRHVPSLGFVVESIMGGRSHQVCGAFTAEPTNAQRASMGHGRLFSRCR